MMQSDHAICTVQLGQSRDQDTTLVLHDDYFHVCVVHACVWCSSGAAEFSLAELSYGAKFEDHNISQIVCSTNITQKRG